MHDFALATLGGVMIGLAAILLMATHGRILGISGITSQLLPPTSGDWPWRLSFLAGVLVAPVLTGWITGILPAVQITDSVFLLVAGGLLVGFGTVYGNGCTSGHGVCGLSRFSVRSVVATVLFMIAAIVVVLVKRWVGA